MLRKLSLRKATLIKLAVGALLGLLSIYILVLYRREGEVHYGYYKFQEYQGWLLNRRIFTTRDICIEEHPSKPGEKVLVIYNSDHVSTREELIYDKHSINSKLSGWPVFHRTGPIPSDHRIMDHPAYFMVTTCEGNFHHIIDDSVLGLYGLLEATGRLGKPKLNQVFTTSCGSTEENGCHSYSRYLDLPLALNVRPDTYGCIAEYPHTNACFEFAGFGFKDSDKKQFYRFLLSQFGLREGVCEGGPGILLVERKSRRVLNMAELERVTRALPELTHSRVERVDFEDLSFREQMNKTFCSHIMVGVQGAGLQWIYFLPEHSAILEIGWKRWGTKYVERGAAVGVKGSFIDARDNMTMNWTDYLKHNKNLGELTDEDKQRILYDRNMKYDRNPYKFADVTIGVGVYLQHLRKLIRELEKDGVKF